MRTLFHTLLAVLAGATNIYATGFFVATNGDDSNPGTSRAPFRTIQRAADVAQPGDVITVRAGIYRERVNPPRGGTSDTRRIVYQAAPGEKVVITGSDLVTNWVQVNSDTWKVTLPNSFFGGFNPYTNIIHGDWFDPEGRIHHTGSVYLSGRWLSEAANLDDVMKPGGHRALWFSRVDRTNTTIWAQFKGVNPNRQNVEINVRQTVFTPSKTGINYLTVRGFDLCDAATPWAPPTAGQIGIISAYWCKGWIIESNKISYSMCSGVALGKYSDEWDNTSANTAGGYVKTINRALTNGWNKATVGSHIVRDNEISHCEQSGIVGSLGCAFSSISNNVIHDIHVMGWFSGAEMAGIKLHGAVDAQICHNHIYRSYRGLWLDWMAQGTHVSGNLFNNNGQDVFVEVDHGPFLIDNNLLLSHVSLLDNSQGGAYAHNLFAGAVQVMRFDRRQTPFLQAHSTAIAGFHDNPRGDDRYYNNLFVQRADLGGYNDAKLPVGMAGNVFLDGAKPCKFEKDSLVEPRFNLNLKLLQKADDWYLDLDGNKAWRDEVKCKLVTTALLGKAKISNCAYENANGSSLQIDTDYFGRPRNKKHPFPGPFETVAYGKQEIQVWPVAAAAAP